MENVNTLEVTLFFDQEIKLDLELGGYRLIPGCREECGLPMEAFLILYAVKDDEKILITGPTDLSRLVARIRNEDEAWRFLRLFTSQETHYLFQKKSYLIDLFLSSDTPSGYGRISPETASRISYKTPTIRLEHHEYFVCRDLVCATRNEISVIRRREALAETGKYRMIEEKQLGKLKPEEILLPSYE